MNSGRWREHGMDWHGMRLWMRHGSYSGFACEFLSSSDVDFAFPRSAVNHTFANGQAKTRANGRHGIKV